MPSNDALELVYLTEIAVVHVDDAESDKRLESLMNLLLGERIPVNFINKTTKEVLVPANTKLTRERLNAIVAKWMLRQLDITFAAGVDAQAQKNISIRLLGALEPDKDWQ